MIDTTARQLLGQRVLRNLKRDFLIEGWPGGGR
jgi:hypothetical protein